MRGQGDERAADRAVVAVGDDAHGVARGRRYGSCARPAAPASSPSRQRRDRAVERTGTAAGTGRSAAEAGSSSSPASIMCTPASIGCTRICPSPAWRSQNASMASATIRLNGRQALGSSARSASAAWRASAWSSASSTSSPRLRLPGCGPSVPRRLRTRGDQPVIVEPEPGAARLDVEAGRAHAAGPASAGPAAAPAGCAARRGWPPAAAAMASPVGAGRRACTSEVSVVRPCGTPGELAWRWPGRAAYIGSRRRPPSEEDCG